MRPVLFNFHGSSIRSYPFFLFLGLSFGIVAGTQSGARNGVDPTRLYIELSRCGWDDAFPSRRNVTPALQVRILENHYDCAIDPSADSSASIGTEEIARYGRNLQSVFNALVFRPP